METTRTPTQLPGAPELDEGQMLELHCEEETKGIYTSWVREPSLEIYGDHLDRRRKLWSLFQC